MNFSPPPTPPNELAVVGENKDDPEQLLLRDAEGNYYAYSLPEEDPRPVDPDERWTVEEESIPDLFA